MRRTMGFGCEEVPWRKEADCEESLGSRWRPREGEGVEQRLRFGRRTRGVEEMGVGRGGFWCREGRCEGDGSAGSRVRM